MRNPTAIAAARRDDFVLLTDQFVGGGDPDRLLLYNGKPTPWTLADLPPDRRTNEDYAIVSRLFHPDTRAMLVEIAGITQYRTAAAADLVPTPHLLAEAFRSAPAGWQKRNVQFVLHVKVISRAPTSPRMVASYFW